MLHKVKKVYQKGGFPLVEKCVKERLFQTNAAWWFIRDLSLPIKEYSSPFKLEVSTYRYNDVLHYMLAKDYVTEQEIHVASAMNHWFVGLVHEGEIKGFCKCGFRQVFVNDYQDVINLPDNLAFIYEYEIDKSLRGQGVGRFFISKVLLLLFDEGYEYVTCHIPFWNIASTKIIEKCGFVKTHFVRFVKIIGIKFKMKDIGSLLMQISSKQKT